MLDWHEYLEIFIAIFVIIDPIGLIPIFISMTADETDADRARTARRAVVAASLVLMAVCFLGEHILTFFGISMASFQVGGGLLILLLSISMLHARVSSSKHTPEEAREAADSDNVAVVPLAIPLLAGPASITTIIIYANRHPGGSMKGFLVLCVLLVGLTVWLGMRVSIPLSRRIGKTAVNTVTRIMGMILAAIAVEFIATGLLKLFPGLG